jgi:outer membrane immunogenic protein
MKYAFLGIAAVAAMLGTQASAADMPLKAPPPPAPVASWTGCYVGVGGGYGFWTRDHQDFFTATGLPTTIPSTSGGRGWLATAQGGCDYQFNQSFVVGVFVDGDWRNMNGNYQMTGAFETANMKMSSSWAAGGRLGYTVTPGLLPFFSAGWTSARVDQANLTTFLGAPTGDILRAQNWNGAFIGGGVEYSLAWLLPNLTWKTEYRYADYGTRSVAVAGTGPLNTAIGDRAHMYSQTVRTELVFRFGGPK